jgi:hypothetical protein
LRPICVSTAGETGGSASLTPLAAIQRTSSYVAQNVNARLAVEVLMLDLPRLQLVAAPPG